MNLNRALFGHLAGLLIVLLVGTGPVAAQDGPSQEQVATDLAKLSFEQLVDLSIDSVYAASAYAQKISEAPASVTIVTHDDIDRFDYRTLADVLRSVRGFYVTNDRNYSYLGVRGFSRPGDFAAGCDDYDTKPVEMARLLDKIVGLLSSTSGARVVT